MTLKYGNVINEIPEEEERSWSKPVYEFAAMFVLLVLILGGVLFKTSTKSVVISETTREISREMVPEGDTETDWTPLDVVRSTSDSKLYIQIPLAARANKVSVENYYQDHTLFIRIKGVHADAFENLAVKGDPGHLSAAAYREYGGEVRISLLMDGVWDYDISQDNSQLIIAPFKAGDRYDKTLVLVTEEGTTDIAEYASDMMTEKLSSAAAQDEIAEDGNGPRPVRIYVVQNRGADYILQFIEDSGADYAVFLRTAESSDPADYGMGAHYNGNYFIPELDNVTIAEIFLRNIASATVGRARYIEQAPEGSILYDLEIPAAEITVGYTSNITEGEYLKNEIYQRSIAEGIINAMKEVTER